MARWVTSDRPSYHDPADRERVDARLKALAIAHDGNAPPEEVVRRAVAYIAFVEEIG